jgi:hypothetical protein
MSDRTVGTRRPQTLGWGGVGWDGVGSYVSSSPRIQRKFGEVHYKGSLRGRMAFPWIPWVPWGAPRDSLGSRVLWNPWAPYGGPGDPKPPMGSQYFALLNSFNILLMCRNCQIQLPTDYTDPKPTANQPQANPTPAQDQQENTTIRCGISIDVLDFRLGVAMIMSMWSIADLRYGTVAQQIPPLCQRLGVLGRAATGQQLQCQIFLCESDLRIFCHK